jgi:hypothetical protein
MQIINLPFVYGFNILTFYCKSLIWVSNKTTFTNFSEAAFSNNLVNIELVKIFNVSARKLLVESNFHHFQLFFPFRQNLFSSCIL